jgi:hypothetical protein
VEGAIHGVDHKKEAEPREDERDISKPNFILRLSYSVQGRLSRLGHKLAQRLDEADSSSIALNCWLADPNSGEVGLPVTWVFSKRYYIRVVVSNSLVTFAIYLAVYGVVGMVIGALTGLLASLVTGFAWKSILKDAFLGWIGLAAGFFGCISKPWPRYAIAVAVATAVLLPALTKCIGSRGHVSAEPEKANGHVAAAGFLYGALTPVHFRKRESGYTFAEARLTVTAHGGEWDACLDINWKRTLILLGSKGETTSGGYS